MTRKLSICVAGWHYCKDFMEMLRVSKHDIHLMVRESPNLRLSELEGINYHVIPDIGLDFGAYSYFHKQIWDGESDVIFCHDDSEILDLGVFDRISKFVEDVVFIFESEEHIRQNLGNFEFPVHGRCIFVKKEILSELDAIWCDEDNVWKRQGIHGDRVNDGVYRFYKDVKYMGANIVTSVVPWWHMGYRGDFNYQMVMTNYNPSYKPNIHWVFPKTILFGDSHTFSFPHLLRVYLSGSTAFNLMKRDREVKEGYKFHAKDEDFKCWWLFGEIDCRIHIYHKHRTEGRDEKELIKNTVDRYLEYVGSLGFDSYILDLVPAGVEDNRFGYKNYASYPKRKEYVILFNLYLEEKCPEYGLKHIPYYYKCVDKFCNRENSLVKDETHLNEKLEKIVIDEFKAIGG